MHSSCLKKLIASIILISSVTYSSFSLATVTMVGNRIIYPADAKERMLQFSNPDNIPYMVQVWTDINTPNSKPESADGPFIATPQLFKIESNQGQVVRLMFNNKLSLPTDRESLFHFNFLQFPGVDDSQKEQNKIVLLVTSRLKIFYRPKKLSLAPEEISEKIKFKLSNNKLEVLNNSPYYATFDKVELLDTNKKVITTVKNPQMVAPFSSDRWSAQTPMMNAAIVKYSLINDFGVSINYQFSL
ncbi:molecular chaperone [Entomomonas moraniae]|uniref:Molecular chaperone n=2 Tax=Entomomonas moraniae TaxID=2213226 RepID=A0A3Q9JIU3_9GAMM|nr:molecular chaperone [Entomomonas moraniae]